MSPEKLAEIREDYMQGFSTRMLAAKYDVPKSTVGRWVKKYGWTQETRLRRDAALSGTLAGAPGGDGASAPLPPREVKPRELLASDEDYEAMFKELWSAICGNRKFEDLCPANRKYIGSQQTLDMMGKANT